MSKNMTGHSIDIQVNPAFVRANEVRVLTGDNSKLNSIIGNRQSYDLEETLTWMLNGRKVTSG
jgi:GDP-D-mannose dehydratase